MASAFELLPGSQPRREPGGRVLQDGIPPQRRQDRREPLLRSSRRVSSSLEGNGKAVGDVPGPTQSMRAAQIVAIAQLAQSLRRLKNDAKMTSKTQNRRS